MSTTMPQGEALKKAVEWVSLQRKEDSSKNIAALADEASFRFDLSPKDSEFLLRFVRDELDTPS